MSLAIWMSIPIWNIFSMITLQLQFQSDLWSNILGRICSLASFRCRLGLAGQAFMCFDTCILFEMRTQNLKSQLVSWMPCSLQFHVCVDYKVEFYCPSCVNEGLRGVPRPEEQPLCQQYKSNCEMMSRAPRTATPIILVKASMMEFLCLYSHGMGFCPIGERGQSSE